MLSLINPRGGKLVVFLIFGAFETVNVIRLIHVYEPDDIRVSDTVTVIWERGKL